MYYNRRGFRTLVSLFLVVMALLSFGQFHPARAASLIVNSLSDDGTVCGGAGVTCLREALAAATAGDTITFAVKGVINLKRGGLTISNNVTVQGPGTAAIAIGSTSLSSINPITAITVANGVTATLSGFTMQNAISNGDGIDNYGTLTVNNCAFLYGNTAYAGGEIYNAGMLTVNSSRFMIGGGIFNTHAGTAVITDSEFYLGAEIDNAGTLTVHGSTFWGDYNGAMLNENSGTLTIDDSTFTAVDYPAVGNFGTATITSSTFTGNIDAIKNFAANPISLGNDIVAGNESVPSANGDIVGPVTSLGYNLIGNGDSATGIANGVNHDQVGTTNAPLNAQLADNGGITQTLALLPGSPAIGNGNCAPNSFDQRGAARKAACDIGAFETPALTLSDITGTTYVNGNYTVQMSASGGVGPYTFALADSTLPPGASLTSGGLLSYPPPPIGNYHLSIAVTDSQNHSGFRGYILNSTPGYNAQITVDTAADSMIVGDSLDDDNCAVACQLRTAALLNDGYSSTITFAPNVQGTILLWPQIGPDPGIPAPGQLSIGGSFISTSLKINGPGASTLAISGYYDPIRIGSNMFSIASNGTLSISGLTITGAATNLLLADTRFGHGIINQGDILRV